MNSPKEHPIATVKWVSPKTLSANGYNPNQVMPPELRLLKVSIKQSGWTQPIVARPDGEIVDGFHRWSLVHPDSPLRDKEIAAMTNGLVPVVYLSADTPMGEQMAATVRHNRARGEHHVLKMADIVKQLIDVEKMDDEQICEYLGMEMEELTRLYDASGMPIRGGKDAFNQGWKPE